MRVLHITNKPIFPLIDGGCVASNELQRVLIHAEFEVKYITISTPKHPFSLGNFPEKRVGIVQPEHVFIDTSIRLKSAIKSVITNQSYPVSRFYSSEFASKIKEQLELNPVGLVILDSIFVLPYLSIIRKFSTAKIFVRAHNVEHQLWQQQIKLESNFFKKWILKKLVSDLKKFEISNLKLVDGILCISQSDQETYSKLGIQTPMITLPISMKERDNKVDYSKKSLFFIGAMNWLPNQQALDWLMNSIFPAIQVRIPGVELHIAGSFSENIKTKNSNIKLHGKVADASHFMQNHGVLIAPFKSGSGVRVKLLEAMNLGVPTLSTSIGFQGIPIESGTHCICLDTEKEMIDTAFFLLENEEKRKEIGENARIFAQQNYSIQAIKEQFIAFFKHQ